MYTYDYSEKHTNCSSVKMALVFARHYYGDAGIDYRWTYDYKKATILRFGNPIATWDSETHKISWKRP